MKNGDRATEALRGKRFIELGYDYKVRMKVMVAFYGPKIDFHLEDCLGRTWQCGAIQSRLQFSEI